MANITNIKEAVSIWTRPNNKKTIPNITPFTGCRFKGACKTITANKNNIRDKRVLCKSGLKRYIERYDTELIKVNKVNILFLLNV
jgi:hypothetical protein